MEIFYWIIGILLIGMGGFVGYSNWKVYFAARKLREQFLKAHPDAKVIKVDVLKTWIYIFILILGFTMGMFLLVSPNAAPAQTSLTANGMVYIGLGIFALAMVGEALMDGKIIASDEAFIFEDQQIRFKNVRNVDIQKGFFKTSMLILTQGKELPISKKAAKQIEELWEEWKKNRKENFHTSRKERRAAARRERGER